MSEVKVIAFNKYSVAEEITNAISHGIGAFLSIAALVLLIIKSAQYEHVSYILTTIIYGISLFFLYTSSTLYHSIQLPKLRNKLNVMDHIAIYFLIAGTYTPYAIITIGGALGWVILGIVWSLALMGFIIKLFFFGKYNTLSAIGYLVMGWIVIFVVKSLYLQLGAAGTFWLFAGGFFYSVGAVLYLLEKLTFNHAIFHFFVLAGSISHFISVYWYVLK